MQKGEGHGVAPRGSVQRPLPLRGLGQPRAAHLSRLPIEGADGTQFIDAGEVRSVRAIASSLSAIRAAGGEGLEIAVDGGIGPDTLEAVARAGANVFIAGNSIFGRPEPAQAIAEFHKILAPLASRAAAGGERREGSAIHG